MRNQSIATKITASALGIVSVLLLAGSFVLIRFEINLINTFTKEHIEKITRSINEREASESESLINKVNSNLEILNKFGGLYIYHFEAEELKTSLKLFMKSPEILAIKASDEVGEPFAAAWRSSDIMVGDAIPDDIQLDSSLSVRVDTMIRGQKIGSFELYYTDAILRENIGRIKKHMVKEAEDFQQASRSRLNELVFSQSLGVFLILLSLVISLLLMLKILILKPINTVSDIACRLANFDLTVRINTDRRDEIGQMFTAVNHMVAAFGRIVSDVKSAGRHLAESSAYMSLQISALASASEEISVNAASVSDTARQMSQNINAVAGSVEEMSSSVNNVRENAREGFRIAGDAVAMAEKAGGTMGSLGEAASRIGEITDMIKRISDKTTLLALNADIEAASAGEAGRGFSVVANEIKEFARQSTEAAEDIDSRISGMQKKTREAVAVIGDVSGIINHINQSSESISLALEEQTKAANEIAANALQANNRANEIAASMVQLAQGANDVSVHVGMAAEGAEIASQNEKERYMDTSAAEISRLAVGLLELVEKFKIDG
jgi:methyl-accepting chemotaxis protein